MSALTIRDLSVAYDGAAVIEHLALDVEDSAIAAILGPSGCGKTTLLRTIAGFLRPSKGTMRIGDHAVVDGHAWIPPERRGVGIVPQEGALFPHLDVRRNIGFGLPKGADAERRIDELLDLIGLPGIGAAQPSELSGGMQQRVALARALAPSPELILLDEPFSALDAGLRASLRHDVRELLRSTGTTALLVTHDQEEALSFADEVAIMRSGRIVQSASPDTIYARPVDLEVARFVGQLVELRGTAQAGRVETPLGDLLLVNRELEDACIVGIRPEQIVLSSASGASANGTVERLTFHGHDHLVEVRLTDDTLVSSRQAGAPRLHPGDRVRCTVQGMVCAFAVPETGSGA